MAARPPAGFAEALIAALRDAEDAAARPKAPATLAEAAWGKLQFDFPVRTPVECDRSLFKGSPMLRCGWVPAATAAALACLHRRPRLSPPIKPSTASDGVCGGAQRTGTGVRQWSAQQGQCPFPQRRARGGGGSGACRRRAWRSTEWLRWSSACCSSLPSGGALPAAVCSSSAAEPALVPRGARGCGSSRAGRAGARTGPGRQLA